MVRSGAEVHQADAGAHRIECEVDVLGDISSFHEGVEGREQRAAHRLELRVGVPQRGLEGIDVGEEGSEVVDGQDEVLVVGLADLLDFGLFGSGELPEVVKKGLGLAGHEGLADERPYVLAVADGRRQQQLVQLVRRVAVFRRRCHFTASLR